MKGRTIIPTGRWRRSRCRACSFCCFSAMISFIFRCSPLQALPQQAIKGVSSRASVPSCRGEPASLLKNNSVLERQRLVGNGHVASCSAGSGVSPCGPCAFVSVDPNQQAEALLQHSRRLQQRVPSAVRGLHRSPVSALWGRGSLHGAVGQIQPEHHHLYW